MRYINLSFIYLFIYLLTYLLLTLSGSAGREQFWTRAS